MTEEEALGIAENEAPAAAQAAPAEPAQAEGQLTRDDMIAMCVRYELASKPYMSEAEAKQVALQRAESEEGYLDEVLAWHEAGEPALDEDAPAPKKAEGGKEPADEDEALGIKE